jgi:hypothetical protein
MEKWRAANRLVKIEHIRYMFFEIPSSNSFKSSRRGRVKRYSAEYKWSFHYWGSTIWWTRSGPFKLTGPLQDHQNGT